MMFYIICLSVFVILLAVGSRRIGPAKMVASVGAGAFALICLLVLGAPPLEATGSIMGILIASVWFGSRWAT